MNKIEVTATVDGREIKIETGRLAKQAGGAVLVSSGNNVVLVTAVSSTNASDMGFFPMTVEYQEKFYASGRIPGGYFKREGRPTELATLTCRLIDRPLRPKFPEGYHYDTQIIATVLSTDGNFPVDILAGIGASAALHVSDIPFEGPVASVRLARLDGKWVLNPPENKLAESDVEMVVSASPQGIMMVEGEADFVSEDDILEALKFAHEGMRPLFDAQNELREKSGSKTKREFKVHEIDQEFKSRIEDELKESILAALNIKTKMERYAAFSTAKNAAKEKFIESLTDESEKKAKAKDLGLIFDDLKYKLARNMILNDGHRIDGRDTKTVRQIDCEAGILPRTHGSALFTRGETQVLGTVTLGTTDDEQMIDSLHGTMTKKFLLHYNFPPFSVGETGRLASSRREIGHGFLAERALAAVLPEVDKFPYTIRIVSEVLESNGSSSMGTVCSGMMALLDAGVPVKGNVAGVAMGLIKEGDKTAILTDILGDEDHLGDMDFKVAGTREGITALQMDIKIDSVTYEIMDQALKQAKEGRDHIISEMEKAISQPRGTISEYAPRFETIKIKPEKVREVIGAGGKVIKEIISTTGVKIDIEDDGTVQVYSVDKESTEKALKMINDIVAEPEVGKVYNGKVKKIMDFGAFVEVLPNSEGLLHISEIAHERIRSVNDVLKEGDRIEVKVLDIDRTGRIKLSRKALLDQES